MGEVGKGKMIEELTKEASLAYDRIITRYPEMDRAVDAQDRLKALHQPVPRPTKAAVEQNKKEVASRHEEGIMASMLDNFEKHPNVSSASRVGEPTMVDPEAVTAIGVVRQMAVAAQGGSATVGAETVNVNGKIAPNQVAPRSDDPAAPAADPAATPAAESAAADPAAAAAELKPNVADPNELKPNVEPDATALPPLQQSNQMDTGNGTSSPSSTTAAAQPEEMGDISSSKKKKKKGISKLNPF
jgi:outer membrane protein assembly factor BamD